MVKKPRAEESVRFVVELIHNLGVTAGTVTLLHVGESDTMPFVQHPKEMVGLGSVFDWTGIEQIRLSDTPRRLTLT